MRAAASIRSVSPAASRVRVSSSAIPMPVMIDPAADRPHPGWPGAAPPPARPRSGSVVDGDPLQRSRQVRTVGRQGSAGGGVGPPRRPSGASARGRTGGRRPASPGSTGPGSAAAPDRDQRPHPSLEERVAPTRRGAARRTPASPPPPHTPAGRRTGRRTSRSGPGGTPRTWPCQTGTIGTRAATAAARAAAPSDPATSRPGRRRAGGPIRLRCMARLGGRRQGRAAPRRRRTVRARGSPRGRLATGLGQTAAPAAPPVRSAAPMPVAWSSPVDRGRGADQHGPPGARRRPRSRRVRPRWPAARSRRRPGGVRSRRRPPPPPPIRRQPSLRRVRG